MSEEPKNFKPVISDFDQYLIGEGSHNQLWRVLGANVIKQQTQKGVHFAVWAPNAQRVSVIGSFNDWNDDQSPMSPAGNTGVWEIFVPDLGEGALYKFRITGADSVVRDKADPVGFGSQHPPEKASVVRDIDNYNWKDADWIKKRGTTADRHQPVSIYEVHLV